MKRGEMKLLLIEDDSTTVESIKLCFEEFKPGCSVTSTGKGLEGLELLKKEKYDAVLIDLGLPDIDGSQVLASMRQFSRIPALVISARQSSDAVDKAMASGADDYVSKPFYYKNLLSRVDNLLNCAH
jgi:DNA-binding response OmpR family regulator